MCSESNEIYLLSYVRKNVPFIALYFILHRFHSIKWNPNTNNTAITPNAKRPSVPYGQLSVDPVSLIVEGFFYSGKSDWVICYSCGTGFRNLSKRDDLFDIHYAAAPHCLKLKSSSSFALNLQVHNPTVDVRRKSFTPENRDLAFLNEAPDSSTFGFLRSKMTVFKVKYKSKLIAYCKVNLQQISTFGTKTFRQTMRTLKKTTL